MRLEIQILLVLLSYYMSLCINISFKVTKSIRKSVTFLEKQSINNIALIIESVGN